MRHRQAAAVSIAVVLAVAGVLGASTYAASSAFTLTSPAFKPGARIPPRFTCDGENSIVPLRWTGAPAGSRSFALIVDDPDAPSGNFLHRLSWGIAGTAKMLPGTAPVEGANGSGRPGWTGPCPPSGTHRYVFRLYALKSKLPLKAGADRDAFEAALKGRVLGVAKLIGRYSRD